MRFLWFLFFIMIGIFLAACGTGGERIPATQTAIPGMITPTQPLMTETLIPTETQSPTFTVTAPPPMDTATPKLVLQLCSPLAEQTIQEIPEIITDPYNPPRPGDDARHHGTDFAYYRRKDRTTIAGELVQALVGGEVVAVIQDQMPYGNMMIIETSRDLLPQKLTSNSKLGFVILYISCMPIFLIRPWLIGEIRLLVDRPWAKWVLRVITLSIRICIWRRALARRTQILWMAWRIMIHGQRLWNVKIMNFGAPVGISATLIPCC